MSILFGICQDEDHAIEERALAELAQATSRYAPDGSSVRAHGRIGMGFQPYHTHRRSLLDSEPRIDQRGNMLTFDGRLDNYREICQLLGLAEETADSLIVLAAFERWGEDCFSRLIGDWAIALWSNADRALYLARDHAGTRTLYYEHLDGRLLWSTHLETFFVDHSDRKTDETFAACFLACQPIGDRTPYTGIGAVTPAHTIVFRQGKQSRKAHWQWIGKSRIAYKTDDEYEDHFRVLFRGSVERRTGPGAPILAHLSGGMDSTSIVCMSDEIRQREGMSSEGFLDTVSIFDDSEPSWNEKPYFRAVEVQRGKRGIHVDASSAGYIFTPSSSTYLWPGADSSTAAAEVDFEGKLMGRGYRVLLSGIGGDELLGGVPNPSPELADCLMSGNLGVLLKQAFRWSLAKRTPVYGILADALLYTGRLIVPDRFTLKQMPPWINAAGLSLIREIQMNCPNTRYHLGLKASSVDAALSWWSALESLPSRFPRLLTRYEYRYPFLDRDLVDFLLRVPPTQLLRSGQRRSLMRRSLADIVPPEILQRRRKAHVIRGPLAAIRDHASTLTSLFSGSQVGGFSFVDESELRAQIQRIETGHSSEWRPLMRAIQFELWIKSSVMTKRLAA